MEIMDNNNTWQPLIYRTFINLEETPQQSLNLGYLLTLILKINDRHIGET